MASSPPVSLTDIQQLEISGHDAFENDVLRFPNAFPGGLRNRVSSPVPKESDHSDVVDRLVRLR